MVCDPCAVEFYPRNHAITMLDWRWFLYRLLVAGKNSYYAFLESRPLTRFVKFHTVFYDLAARIFVSVRYSKHL